MAGGQSAFGDDEGAVLSDINVVPLVDVVLVLLIVFMITVPAIVGSAPIKIDLPETSSAAEQMGQVEDLPLHLYLRRESSGEVILYLNDAPTNEAGLRTLLNGYADSKEKPPTYLAADKGIAYGEVVKVIDMLSSLGLHKISLDTKHVEKTP
ncbi:MAG TPA: biopolymer transporter ExbD [Pirellulales bacterium]|jgi:biopolymer transport protein ExbD|nr:biopolymer transporter ExbD [Pirellulales bacterium]